MNRSEDETIEIPEYEENAFIARLPSLKSKREILSGLVRKPSYKEAERGYPAHIRRHCIVRLNQYFEPLERQLLLAEKVDMIIRQGYVGRNPNTTNYIRHLHIGAERIEAKSLELHSNLAPDNTASSFGLIGCSGMGKSLSIDRVLKQYPQTIVHHEPFSLIQIPWLKLECPHLGSPKHLCKSFFSVVDKLIGTDYQKQYGYSRASIDDMMLHMAHVANLHAIGVLVIDEIQHLSKSRVGSDAVLNFLVTLVNTIGVPVILIGTLSAIPMLQDNFRHARRASGVGSIIWDRFPRDKTWNYFIEKLWDYQWLKQKSNLTPEIRDVLYDESQGIMDIVVKLFMLSQLRIVGISEFRNNPEEITVELIRKVAKEDFKIVQPMINALRKNDNRALLKYDDLMPFQEHVNQAVASAFNGYHVESGISTTEIEKAVDDEVDGSDTITRSLRSLGISDDVISLVLRDAKSNLETDDPFILMSEVMKILSTENIRKEPAIKKSAKVKKSYDETIIEGDIREIGRISLENGSKAYDLIKNAGLIKSPALELVG